MELNFSIRLRSFSASLAALEDAETLLWPENPDACRFIWSGILAKFCITFDLAWKLTRDVLAHHHKRTDFIAGSPKKVLEAAFQTEMIEDDAWVDMLQLRNEIAHEYKDDETVQKWGERVIGDFIPLFRKLRDYVDGISAEAGGSHG